MNITLIILLLNRSKRIMLDLNEYYINNSFTQPLQKNHAGTNKPILIRVQH